MPTIVDSLIVELGLDSSKFDMGQRRSTESLERFDETSQKTNKNQLEGSKKLAEGFGKATNALIGFATVAVGANGFKNFVSTIVTGNAELGRNAKLMGMSAQEITAWGSVLSGVGGKAEDFVSSIQNIKGAIARLQTGTGGQQILAPMNMLGLSLQDVDDPLKLAQAFQRYSESNGMEAALARAQDLGVNQNTFQAMVRTDKSGQFTVNSDYKAALATAEATKKDTDAAEDLAKKWSEFGAKIDQIKQKIMREFMPVLDKMLDKALLLAGGFDKLDDKSKAWLITLTAIGAILGTKIFSKAVMGLLGLGAGAAAAPAVVAAAGGVTAAQAAAAAAAAAAAGAAGGAGAGAGASMAARIALMSSRFGTAGFALGGGYLAGTLLNKGVEKYGFDNKASIGTKIFDAVEWVKKERDGANRPKTVADFSKTERKYGLPAGFLDAQWMQESARGKKMLSPAGAMGHFQFMPGTLKEVGLTKEGAYDLGQSSEAAGLYMSRLLERYGGDLPKALAGYNAGMGNVDKAIKQGGADWMNYLPRKSETIPYIYNIMRQTEINQGVRRGAGGASTSEVNINTMNINTQATNATDMSKDVKEAFRKNSLTAASAGGAQ